MFDLRVEVTTNKGISLIAEVTDATGLFWKAALDYPTLPHGDPNGQPDPDTNPLAFFKDLVGDICDSMKQYALTDSDPAPLAASFKGAGPRAMHQFQGILLQAAGELWKVGKAKLRKKGIDSDDDEPGRRWKQSRSRPRGRGKS